jgi:multiple sugar transport system substrate-binding protein
MPLEPLRFAFWRVRPDIVRDNLARYAAARGEQIEPLELAGDFVAEIEAGWAHGAGAAALYAQRAEAARWAAQERLDALDDWDEIAPLLARMDPRLVASARHVDGRLLGLTYYNAGPFALFRNERLLARAGCGGGHDAAGYPRDWATLTAQARALKRDGLSAHPILPRWHDSQTGIVWSLLTLATAEGERFVDGDLAAVFDDDTPIAETLSLWRAWWDEELVPREALDGGDDGLAERWMSGAHAFHPTQDYAGAIFASADRALCHIHPALPGRTGQPSLPGHALLCVRAGLDGKIRTRARQLIRYLGGDDADGSLVVHRRWLRDFNLPAPFPELAAERETRDALLRFLHPPLADAALAWLLGNRARAEPLAIVRAPWFLDWSARAHRAIADRFLRQRAIGVAPLVRELRADWQRLREHQV